jgi:electron transfer flavoprotein beta subunit
MQIIVAVKPVPEGESRLRPNPTKTGLDPEGIKWVLAGYDESAVEQALLLKETVPGSTVRAVTFAPAPRGEEVLRAATALGCDTATWIEQPGDLYADPILSARAVGAALAAIPRDLVLTGKQSGDEEGGLFGSALAEVLGIPSFGHVVNLRWETAAGRLTFDRAVEEGLESFAVAPPCLIGLQQAWNDPRTAKLPNILKSRKAPIDRVPWTVTATALGPHAVSRQRPISFDLPPPRTGAKMIAYKTPEEAATELVRLLREEAKVFP